MTTTVDWHSTEKRVVHIGLDRGVLFADGKWAAWSGLVSVDERNGSGDVTARYIDGRLFYVTVPPKDYKARMSCYTYPDLFGDVIGDRELDETPLIYTGQPHKTFDLCYRTKSQDASYREEYTLHFLYGVVAREDSRSYTTTSSNQEPTKFEFDLYGVPPSMSGGRPTSHLKVRSGSVTPEQWASLESIVYGSAGSTPAMPSIEMLRTVLSLPPLDSAFYAFGESGRDSNDLQNRTHPYRTFLPLIRNHLRCDTFISEISTNDLVVSSTPVATFRANLITTRNQLNTAGIYKFWAVLMPNAGGDQTPYRNVLEDLHAEGYIDRLLDARNMVLDSTSVIWDGLHWTNEGTAAFANILAEELMGDDTRFGGRYAMYGDSLVEGLLGVTAHANTVGRIVAVKGGKPWRYWIGPTGHTDMLFQVSNKPRVSGTQSTSGTPYAFYLPIADACRWNLEFGITNATVYFRRYNGSSSQTYAATVVSANGHEAVITGPSADTSGFFIDKATIDNPGEWIELQSTGGQVEVLGVAVLTGAPDPEYVPDLPTPEPEPDPVITYEWLGTPNDSISVKKSNGTVVLQNRILKPKFTNPVTVIYGAGGTGTVSYSGEVVTVTTTNQPTGLTYVWTGSGTYTAVTPGEQITMSAYVSCVREVRIVALYNLGGTFVRAEIGSYITVSNDPDNPTRITYTNTVGAGVDRMRFYVGVKDVVGAVGMPPGNPMTLSRAMVTGGATAVDWFDGDGTYLAPPPGPGVTDALIATHTTPTHAAFSDTNCAIFVGKLGETGSSQIGLRSRTSSGGNSFVWPPGGPAITTNLTHYATDGAYQIAMMNHEYATLGIGRGIDGGSPWTGGAFAAGRYSRALSTAERDAEIVRLKGLVP